MSKKPKSNKKEAKAEERPMKLSDIVILSLAVVFVIIAMYEIMAVSPSSGYWAVMLAMICFFYYFIRKNR
jgi:hypothetical protein